MNVSIKFQECYLLYSISMIFIFKETSLKYGCYLNKAVT